MAGETSTEEEKAAFDAAAQAEHERLQQVAREHWEQTGEELSELHWGGCWCCCWDEPCDSTRLPTDPTG